VSSAESHAEPIGSTPRRRRFERPDVEGRRAPDLGLTAGVYVAIVAATFPLVRVVNPGTWSLGVLLLPAILLAAGYLARRYRIAAVGVSLIEAAVWALIVTVIFLSGSAFLGFLPVPATVGAAADLVDQAFDHIITGAAPLDAGTPLSFLIVGSIGLLTIGIDHVVLTARMPLLAAIGLIVVSLIPAIAVPSDVDVLAFVFLAAALLFLLRAETRSRDSRMPKRTAQRVARAPRNTGVAAAATGIGAIAVVVALVAAPLFPATATPGGVGGGRWNSIDPTLQLGEDLRRPTDGQVLTLQTDASAAPYLRAATLSSFDGKIWRPDTGRPQTLADDGSIGGIQVADGVRLTRYKTDVEITNLLSGWLPISYPAVKVTGLQGEWGVLASNRTVLSRSTSANGQHYEVVADVPRPTLEQIRASSATGDLMQDAMKTLPLNMPEIVKTLADQVTSDATTDYDRLLALQAWFRSGNFQYSLDAPVEAGFDGTGVDAVARFLEERKGYCIHFAGAFALMARTLGMSSRIVVGYLPGQPSNDPVTHQKVYTVMSSQLHAWPEVYFAGIGWVPFEPTNSLGTPTSFSPASSDPTDTGGTDVGPTPSASSSTGPSASGRPDNIRPDDATPTDASGAIVRPLPWLATLLALVLLLAVPSAVREFRRRELLAGARAGDAAAAWRSLQDTAIDLSIPEPPGESPRAFGTRLIERYGAPEDETWILIEAIERASYSPAGIGRYGPDLESALTTVRAALMAKATRGRRMLAVLAPRSLVIKPGSVYAVDGVRARS
jgi:transglutaminase-like putative cysteine protease